MMLAITLWQPWLLCFSKYDKRVENRSWPLPQKHIGQPVALHAGARRPKLSDIQIASILAGDKLPRNPLMYELGSIVATAVVRGCVHMGAGGQPVIMGDVGDYDPRNDRWFAGKYGHVYSDIKVLTVPVPCKGQQRYWYLPAEIEGMINYD